MENLQKKRYSTVAFYFLALVLMAVQVNGQSYNADEAVRLYFITFEPFKQAMEYGLQQRQPLFMLAAWLWESLLGQGERAMRAMNIPFALVMVWYTRKILSSRGKTP